MEDKQSVFIKAGNCSNCVEFVSGWRKEPAHYTFRARLYNIYVSQSSFFTPTHTHARHVSPLCAGTKTFPTKSWHKDRSHFDYVFIYK